MRRRLYSGRLGVGGSTMCRKCDLGTFSMRGPCAGRSDGLRGGGICLRGGLIDGGCNVVNCTSCVGIGHKAVGVASGGIVSGLCESSSFGASANFRVVKRGVFRPLSRLSSYGFGSTMLRLDLCVCLT